MELKHKCLWPDLVAHIPTYPALQGEAKADVCVIGAGFTGLSAAIRLRELGQSVRVLEGTHLAYGGSGAMSAWSTQARGSSPMSLTKFWARKRARNSIRLLVVHRNWCLI